LYGRDSARVAVAVAAAEVGAPPGDRSGAFRARLAVVAVMRYLAGLATACAVYVAVFTTVVLATAPAARVVPPAVLVVALTFGVIGLVVSAAVIGPAVLIVRTAAGGRLHPALASLIGGVLSPLCVFAIWFLFRESGETITGLLTFWLRLPGEFVGGVVPWMLANAAFAWMVVTAGRERLPAPGRA
jgi:hypothetical protein